MIGQRFKSNKFGWVEIIDKGEKGNVTIRFDDTGATRIAAYSAVAAGQVRDFYAPTVAGIGFIGDGKHKTCVDGGMNSHAYSSWRGILSRIKSKDQIYPDWLNFQNFADWFYANVKDGYKITVEVGKDGGRYFSPETCRFLHKNAKFVAHYTKECPRPKIDIMTALRLHGRKIDFGRVAAI